MWRPALPFFLIVLQDLRAFGEAARHGEDQRHGQVGGVFGEHGGRVRHRDAARQRARHVDMVDAVGEGGDEPQVFTRLGQHGIVDAVRNGGDKDVRRLHGFHQLGRVHGDIVHIQAGVEQFPHARFHAVGQLSRDDHKRLATRHGSHSPFLNRSRPVYQTGGETQWGCARLAWGAPLTQPRLKRRPCLRPPWTLNCILEGRRESCGRCVCAKHFLPQLSLSSPCPPLPRRMSSRPGRACRCRALSR